LHASKINTGQAAKGKKPPRNRWPEGKKKGNWSWQAAKSRNTPAQAHSKNFHSQGANLQN